MTQTDALGEAKVKIRDAEQGTVFSGRGVSTDVIKASIKAYLGAVNKWTEQYGQSGQSWQNGRPESGS